MWRNDTRIKQCGHCGLTVTNYQYEYYCFQELIESYRVGYTDICDKCATKADKFVNYYGLKKQKDLDNLHRYLISGILPMKQYTMLMNAGYY